MTKKTKYGNIGDKFAIKVYKPWILNQKKQAIRILREFQAGMKHESYNLVKTFELGQENDSLYLVMKLIEGKNLREYLDSKELDFSEIVSISKDILNGINLLHKSGFIHRDIKPENVMITSNGAVLMDLGVIKDLNSANNSITGDAFLGTIRYAAPEYLFNKPYDRSIDIYSFGLILLELVYNYRAYGNKDYWTEIILAKHSEEKYAISPSIGNKEFEKFGFNQACFLKVLIVGALKAPPRLSIDKILNALNSSSWETNFLHYISNNVIDIWPSIPESLEMKLNHFILEPKTEELISIGHEIKALIYSSFNEIWCYDDNQDRVEHINKLNRLGLLDHPSSNEQCEYATRLTDLSWQLVLKGIF